MNVGSFTLTHGTNHTGRIRTEEYRNGKVVKRYIKVSDGRHVLTLYREDAQALKGLIAQMDLPTLAYRVAVFSQGQTWPCIFLPIGEKRKPDGKPAYYMGVGTISLPLESAHLLGDLLGFEHLQTLLDWVAEEVARPKIPKTCWVNPNLSGGFIMGKQGPVKRALVSSPYRGETTPPSDNGFRSL